VGANQPKAIRDWTYKPVGGELLPDNLPGYARNLAEIHEPGRREASSRQTRHVNQCCVVPTEHSKIHIPCGRKSASLPGYARLAIRFGYFKISDDSSSLSWTPFEFFQWINPFVFPPRTTLPAVLGEPNSTSLANIK